MYNKVKFILIISILIAKVLFNGIQVGGYSIWFYLFTPLVLVDILYHISLRYVFNSTLRKFITTSSIFLMYSLVVYFFNDLVMFGIEEVVKKILMIYIVISISQLKMKKQDINYILISVLFAITISGIIGLLQFLYPEINKILAFFYTEKDSFIVAGRVSGLSATVITFSYELIIGVLISFYYALRKKNNRIYLLIFILLSIVLFINQTRSAIIATMLIIVFLIVNYRYSKKQVLSATVTTVIISAIFLYILTNLGIQFRFSSDVSSSARFPMLITAFKYSFMFPFGTGIYHISSFPNLYSSYSLVIFNQISSNTTHNSYANTLVYFGFIGLIIEVYLTKIIFSVGKKNEFSILFVGLILGYLLNGLFHNAGIFGIDPLIWSITGLYISSGVGN